MKKALEPLCDFPGPALGWKRGKIQLLDHQAPMTPKPKRISLLYSAPKASYHLFCPPSLNLIKGSIMPVLSYPIRRQGLPGCAKYRAHLELKHPPPGRSLGWLHVKHGKQAAGEACVALNSEHQNVWGLHPSQPRHFLLLMKTETQLQPEGSGREQMCGEENRFRKAGSSPPPLSGLERASAPSQPWNAEAAGGGRASM